MTQNPQVFISYRRGDDLDLARALHEHLFALGVDAFFDDSPTNNNNDELINRDFFLVILTSGTHQSELVRQEIHLAITHDKQIIPLVADARFRYDDLPEDLSKLASYPVVKYDVADPAEALIRLQRIIKPEFERRNDPPFAQRKIASDVQPAPVQRMIPMVIIAGALFMGLVLIFTIRAITPPPQPMAENATPDMTLEAIAVAPTPAATVPAGLMIATDDTPDVVIGKALALRQMGNISQAVAAYRTYGDMFAGSDEDAASYAEIAAQFTRQIGGLGVEGGAYITSIQPDSIAMQNNLMRGDIVITLNDTPINNHIDMGNRLETIADGESIDITYLRMDTEGRFIRYTASMTFDGNLGAEFLPI